MSHPRSNVKVEPTPHAKCSAGLPPSFCSTLIPPSFLSRSLWLFGGVLFHLPPMDVWSQPCPLWLDIWPSHNPRGKQRISYAFG